MYWAANGVGCERLPVLGVPASGAISPAQQLQGCWYLQPLKVQTPVADWQQSREFQVSNGSTGLNRAQQGSTGLNRAAVERVSGLKWLNKARAFCIRGGRSAENLLEKAN
jgi:hypothetical protein